MARCIASFWIYDMMMQQDRKYYPLYLFSTRLSIFIRLFCVLLHKLYVNIKDALSPHFEVRHFGSAQNN